MNPAINKAFNIPSTYNDIAKNPEANMYISFKELDILRIYISCGQ